MRIAGPTRDRSHGRAEYCQSPVLRAQGRHGHRRAPHMGSAVWGVRGSTVLFLPQRTQRTQRKVNCKCLWKSSRRWSASASSASSAVKN